MEGTTENPSPLPVFPVRTFVFPAILSGFSGFNNFYE